MKRSWTAFLLISVILGVSIVIFGQTRPFPTYSVSIAKPAGPPTIQGLLNFTNKERVKAGLPPLRIDTRLNHSAQLKAEDEHNHHYFGHVNPATGRHGFAYIIDEHIPGCRGAENLTQNIYVNDSRHAVDAWMSSKPHKAAILSSKDLAVGFGISGNYIVQHFCTSW